MNREKIDFPTNVPVEVSLAFEKGRPINTQYGDSVMFTTTDDRVFFGPPILQERILNLGVQRGETFLITRAEKKIGQRRTTEWQVGRSKEVEPQQAQPIKAVPAAAPVEAHLNSAPVNGIADADLERQLRESIHLAKNNGATPHIVNPGSQPLIAR